jgi:hypothetical protein
MDARTLLQAAVWLFAIAAAGGIVMAGIRFGGQRNPPAWLSMLHGLLAAAGLTLTLYASIVADAPGLARAGAGLLLVAAAGGAFLNLAFQWKQRLLPASIVVVHAVLAVAGFLCVALAAYG